MREYLKFSMCDETGEARITPASDQFIGVLIQTDPLLAADLLKDIAQISDALYRQACDAMGARWELQHEAAIIH